MTPAEHEAVALEVEAAYVAGQLDERQRIACAGAELEATWRPAGRRGYAAKVAERLADMQRYASNNKAATWRGFYPGGAVDYETGQLVDQRIGAAA